jgi:Flp pilus assembly pilin Flp
MNHLRNLVSRFAKEEDGIVAVEYALIVSIISALVVVAVALMDFNGIYTKVSTNVKALIK